MVEPLAAAERQDPDPRIGQLFEDFAPRLRQALLAYGGSDDIDDAVADTFAYLCEHSDRVLSMANPHGYLYRVARSRVSRSRRRHPALPPVPQALQPEVEPGLPAALATLSDKQRVSVFLTTGLGWSAREVGEFLGIGESSVRNHCARGLAKLRAHIGEVTS